ncbi:secreted protein [gut metagenome]|uniref:Secreted protein n=1 Tax=gut metagenome TaxID=749906 RepID=J9GRD8_9ZZZZ
MRAGSVRKSVTSLSTTSGSSRSSRPAIASTSLSS